MKLPFLALVLLSLSGCSTLESISTWFDELVGNEPVQQTIEQVEAGAYKKRFLILNFINKTSFDTASLQDPIFNEIKAAALRTPDVILATENEISKGENPVSDETGYNMKTVFDVARAHGFSGVILGSIEDLDLEQRSDEVGLFPSYSFNLQAKVSLQLYEVATERELINRTESAALTQEFIKYFEDRTPASDEAHRLSSAVAEATKKTVTDFPMLVRRVAWGGQIVKIDRHRYFINAGEDTGITKGQLLKVMGEGFVVTDEKSKVHLGMAPGPFKGLLKVVDYLGKDGAVAVIHSGGGFSERDRVEVFTATP